MFVYLSLQGIEKETPLQVKVALVNVNFPYKMVIYTQFSELSLCLLFLKNNQLKILHTPNRHILGWHKIYTHILYSHLENVDVFVSAISLARFNQLLQVLSCFCSQQFKFKITFFKCFMFVQLDHENICFRDCVKICASSYTESENLLPNSIWNLIFYYGSSSVFASIFGQQSFYAE